MPSVKPADEDHAMSLEDEEAPPLRILLAEDDLINQKVAEGMLALLGHKADIAVNGLEALEALERKTYDVVLLDVQMPELDGLETARRIRQRWTGSERPWVIGVTANVVKGDRETCLAAGMDDYMTKPVDRDKLGSALDRRQAPALR